MLEGSMPKKRDRHSIPLKPNLHIYCEGQKTEPGYLSGYIELCFPGTRLSPVRDTPKNTPVQLVDAAITAKHSSPEGDVFWVVFDREATNKYSNTLHLQARQKAHKHGIHIAFSNVCFEVWLLLHFENTVKAYSCYADLRKRSKISKHIPKYDKGTRCQFSKSQIDSARGRARRMNKQTQSGADPSWRHPHQWNPYTNVYSLLDAIDEFSQKYY